MSNIHCKICNEPWDIYGLKHGDVAAWEANQILKGNGCPSCTANGFVPKEDYVKPKPLIIFTCAHCHKDIEIDQNDITYDGDKLIYESPSSYDSEDGRICEECNHDCYEICYKCNKKFNVDDTYFLQDLENGVVVCEDCMNNYVVTCQSCQQNVWAEETKDGLCESCQEHQDEE